jgi:hypothetical protein
VLEQNSNINMKVALFAIVLLAAVLALAHAAFIPKDIDVASLDPQHAKVLLALAQHKCANATEAECRAFFEPAPFDHCCKVPRPSLQCPPASCPDRFTEVFHFYLFIYFSLRFLWMKDLH